VGFIDADDPVVEAAAALAVELAKLAGSRGFLERAADQEFPEDEADVGAYGSVFMSFMSLSIDSDFALYSS
jgi:hypothetical protein